MNSFYFPLPLGEMQIFKKLQTNPKITLSLAKHIQNTKWNLQDIKQTVHMLHTLCNRWSGWVCFHPYVCRSHRILCWRQVLRRSPGAPCLVRSWTDHRKILFIRWNMVTNLSIKIWWTTWKLEKIDFIWKSSSRRWHVMPS